MLFVCSWLRVKSNLHEEAFGRSLVLGKHVEALVEMIARIDAVLTSIRPLPAQSYLSHVSLRFQLGLVLGYLCLVRLLNFLAHVFANRFNGLLSLSSLVLFFDCRCFLPVQI